MLRIAAVAAMVVLAGCSRLGFLTPGGPDPYLSTSVCGVVVDGKTREARLRIELAPVRRIPRNAVLEVEFENPADRNAPLLSSRVLTGEERVLVMLSPRVTNLPPRGYEVVVRLYVSPEKKQVLGVVTHLCPALVDQREVVPR